MRFSYSITLSSFIKIQSNDSETLENLSQIGITNAEMYGEPKKIDRNYYKDILSAFNFQVVGITGMWGKSSKDGWKRRLLSRDRGILKYSENYVLECIDLCSSLGGKVFNICLFSDPVEFLDVTHSNIKTSDKKNLIERCIPILRKFCSYAEERNVKLVLEPLNRYSTPYCCNYDDTKLILEKCHNMYLMLDTFHMNIEEDSFSDTISDSQIKLIHMHFADNNRKMPGEGHIDFTLILQSLEEIRYRGFISFEPTISEKNYSAYVKSGFDYIKSLESSH